MERIQLPGPWLFSGQLSKPVRDRQVWDCSRPIGMLMSGFVPSNWHANEWFCGFGPLSCAVKPIGCCYYVSRNYYVAISHSV